MLLQLPTSTNKNEFLKTERSDNMEYALRQSFVTQAQSLIQKNLQPKNYAYSNITERKSTSQRLNLSFEAQNKMNHTRYPSHFDYAEDSGVQSSMYKTNATTFLDPEKKVHIKKKLNNQSLSKGEEQEYWMYEFNKKMQQLHHPPGNSTAESMISDLTYNEWDDEITQAYKSKQKKKKEALVQKVRKTKDQFEKYMSKEYLNNAFLQKEKDVDEYGNPTKTAQGLQFIP